MVLIFQNIQVIMTFLVQLLRSDLINRGCFCRTKLLICKFHGFFQLLSKPFLDLLLLFDFDDMLLSTFVYLLFKHLLLLAQAVKVPESLFQLFDPFHLEYLQVLHVFYLLRVDHGEVGVCKLIFLFWRQVVFIRVLHCERRPPSFKVLRI